MHITTFRNYLQFEKRYSPHTIQAYVSDVEQFAVYLSQTYDINDPEELRHVHIRSWMVHMLDSGVTARSLNRKLSSLRTWYRLLRRQKLASRNPFAKVTGPKISRKLPEVIDTGRLDHLFHGIDFPEGFAGARDRMLLQMLYSCGMRRSEITGLEVSDIDFSRGVIRVRGKGRKERHVPVTRELVDALRDYMKVRDEEFATSGQGGALFFTNSGKPIYPKLVYNIVRKYLGVVTNIDSRGPHALRHAFATHLAENGADINAIKELLGHSSLAATQVYMHTSAGRLKRAYDKAHPKA